ncbi:hypothetical protein GCM10027347_54130 [Larkinella harenae]
MPNERYSKFFKMYTTDHQGDFRIQFHRFEEDSPLHPLLQKRPHIAFQVDNVLEAIEGKRVLVNPYEPIPGYKVAIIDDVGMPIELIETDLTIKELWDIAQKQDDLKADDFNQFDSES